MNISKVIENTNAYKIMQNDVKSNMLSHAYLIVCDDSRMLEDYLKVFAKLIMSQSKNTSRIYSFIDKKTECDVAFYPKDKKITVKDIDDIVNKTYIKPLEEDRKLYVLSNVQDMNAQAQNKFLKTLEEPPKNNYVLMGTTSVYPLLSTILSRVKKFEISCFTNEDVVSAINDECEDKARLQSAVNGCGGKIGEALNIYENATYQEIVDFAYEVLLELEKSSQICKYNYKLNKDNIAYFISILSQILNDVMLNKYTGKQFNDNAILLSNKYNEGAIVFIQDKLRQAEKALTFNGNIQMVADSILFGILEGKHKWSK